MKCPFCGNNDTQVKDSRATEDNSAIRRRRFCSACGARFTTFERIQLRELTVLKKSGKKVPFDRDKLEMPGLSVAHIRANFETGAGPLKRMVEAFADEPEKLSSLRNEIDKCIAGYFEDNLLRMDFLMAKGKKP